MADHSLWSAFARRSVFGFHGNTESRIAQAERNGFHREGLPGDWLGGGLYFWLDAPGRAWQWADAIVALEAQKHPDEPRDEPKVIIAELEHTEYWIDLIDSSPWFDRLSRMAEYLEQSGLLPDQNSNLPASVLHARDYVVIEAAMNSAALEDMQVDAVRCAFIEGKPVYERSAIYDKAHVQIAIRNPDVIRDHEHIARPVED